MKAALIASLVLAQLPLASLAAASIDDDTGIREHRAGAFAGARFRVPIGGDRAGKPVVGIGVSGLTQSRSSDGRIATRFSEGAQFGFSDRSLGLSVGGKPLNSPALGVQAGRERSDEDDEDGGISTLGIVGIVAGGVLIVGSLLFIDAMNDASE